MEKLPLMPSQTSLATKEGFMLDPQKSQRTAWDLAVAGSLGISDDSSLFDLNHSALHLVHDSPVVGGHDDGGAGEVDAAQKPHDLFAVVRV
jgi:hypothetical protein